MARFGKIAYCVATLTVLVHSAKAVAQDAGKAVGGLQIAQVSGTVQAWQLNQIKVVAEDKKEYFAVVSDQTSLQFKGTAEPDFLMPGLLVRFSAELNQSGVVQAPVTELEVFTISQQRRMTPEQTREQTAGVYQVGGEVGNVKKPGDKSNDKAAAKQTGASAKGAQPYRVVGQIAGMQAGKMFVQAGTVRVQLEIDPKAVIKVSARDTTFCQIGDEVKVSGLRNAGQEQFIQAESVEIVGKKPLAPVEGKTAKNSKSTKTAKGKGSKASDKDDAGGDDKKSDAKKPDPKKSTTKK